MKAYKKTLIQHGLSTEEVKNVEREIRLATFASLFNNHMKMEGSSPVDEIPQMMLTLIHKEFDDEREEAEWQNDNLFLEATDFELAVEHVRSEIDMKRVEDADYMLGTNNMELADVDEELDDQIRDLMEEYGADNGLPEGWWESEATTEDIVKIL